MKYILLHIKIYGTHGVYGINLCHVMSRLLKEEYNVIDGFGEHYAK